VLECIVENERKRKINCNPKHVYGDMRIYSA
jgi:hypothetical protein